MGNGWLNIKNFDIRNSLFDIRYLHAIEVAGFFFDLVENRGHLYAIKY